MADMLWNEIKTWFLLWKVTQSYLHAKMRNNLEIGLICYIE